MAYRKKSASRSGYARRSVGVRSKSRSGSYKSKRAYKPSGQTIRIVVESVPAASAGLQNGMTVAPQSQSLRKARF